MPRYDKAKYSYEKFSSTTFSRNTSVTDDRLTNGRQPCHKPDRYLNTDG